MIFLPKILYLFQNIPIFLPKIFFKQLDSIIIPFLWDYKAHIIGKAHLCKPKAVGGMALPNFALYYYACALQNIIMWLDHTIALSTWIQMEREACRPYDIGAVLLSPIKIDKSVYKHNCIIHSTIRIWKQIKSKFSIKPLSFLLPISGNPSFTPSTMDAAFTKWRDLGLQTIGNLFINGTFATFRQLQDKYGLHASTFFRYLQIRDYVRKHIPCLNEATAASLDDLLGLGGGVSHLISVLYKELLSKNLPSTESLKLQWEQELGEEICSEFWADALEQGSLTLDLEVHFPAEFSSNPNQIHLNKLIKVFRINTKLQVAV